jgi:DNA-binding LacI/PurR family transcriptional regulator
MPSHVTQKQIAEAAQVHPSTVSLALRGQAKIPKLTRERVQAAAEKLGYVRDPMLGALAAYRLKQTNSGFHGTVAWLAWSTPTRSWDQVPQYREYFDGARARAAELGYRIEVHLVGKPGFRVSRFAQIIQARGIRAALVCPLPETESALEIDWSQLAAVAFGYTLKKPQLHVVTAHQFDAMQTCVRKMRAAGRKRIGFALSDVHNQRLNGAYLWAFRQEQANWRSSERVEPYSTEPSFGEFRAWFRRTKPDALITAHYQFPEFLKKLGVRVPEDLSVALVSTTDRHPGFAGIDEGSREIGSVAVDLVTAMAERGQYGVPLRPQFIQVRGNWRDAASVSPTPLRT